MDLNIKQTAAIDFWDDKITTEILFGGAAGGGKSALGCYLLLKYCLKYPGTRWLMGRSTLKALKQTTLNTFFEIAKKQNVPRDIIWWFNDQKNIIFFRNGSEILLADLFQYPADPMFDSLGSLEISGAFIDECNQITEKAKNIVMSRIRYKLDEYGLIPKLFMTCNPAKNWVYYEFYQPYRQGELPRYKQFIPALVHDNAKNISKHYIENLQKLDTVSRERLLMGNWEYDDDPSSLMTYDKILDCFEDRPLPATQPERYITGDIARFGKDKTVIGLWQGTRVRLFVYRGYSTTRTAEAIRVLQLKYQVKNSCTIVDEDGVGGGVVDTLRCKGFVNNSRPVPNRITGQEENYVNLKSQCYFKLAEQINDRAIYIECPDINMKADIVQELEQVKQYNMDKDGKKAIMPKDKVKEVLGRSPDYSDMLMMRMYFELVPQRSWVIV